MDWQLELMEYLEDHYPKLELVSITPQPAYEHRLYFVDHPGIVSLLLDDTQEFLTLNIIIGNYYDESFDDYAILEDIHQLNENFNFVKFYQTRRSLVLECTLLIADSEELPMIMEHLSIMYNVVKDLTGYKLSDIQSDDMEAKLEAHFDEVEERARLSELLNKIDDLTEDQDDFDLYWDDEEDF